MQIAIHEHGGTAGRPPRRPRQRRRLAGAGTGLVALAVAAPLVLGACSSNASSSNSASNASGQRAPEGGGAAAQANAGGAAAPQANGDAAANGSGASTTGVKLSARSLIITAGLQVKTDDAAAAAQRAQIITEGAGGYVSGESIGPGSQAMPSSSSPSGSSSSAPSADSGGTSSPATLPDVSGSSNSTQALLVLRVPPQSVDSVLAQLSGKGSVTYQSRSATDVTGQVADVASRVSSAQAAIAELRTLIDKAASMNDLISLEQALAQRESDLESLEAQQKALTDQIQYATITVGYFSQGAPVAPPAVRTGFMRGLTVGWHGFLDVVRALLATIGWLLPYLVVIIVLWWPVRRLVRLVRQSRARRNTSTPVASSAPSEN